MVQKASDSLTQSWIIALWKTRASRLAANEEDDELVVRSFPNMCAFSVQVMGQARPGWEVVFHRLFFCLEKLKQKLQWRSIFKMFWCFSETDLRYWITGGQYWSNGWVNRLSDDFKVGQFHRYDAIQESSTSLFDPYTVMTVIPSKQGDAASSGGNTMRLAS